MAHPWPPPPRARTLSRWERLPDELLLRVLEHVIPRFQGWKEWCGAVRGVSRQWRALHDAHCQCLYVPNGVTNEGMHVLCGGLPTLSLLSLPPEVTSLTEDGLRAVGGLTALTRLHLSSCSNVTDRYMKATESLSGRDTRTKPATQQQQQQHQQHHQQ